MKLFLYLVFLIGTFSDAQSGGRLRVWVNTAAASYAAIGNLNAGRSNNKFTTVLEKARQAPSTGSDKQGYYIEVDTTTTAGNVYLVTTTDDAGPGSFRQAITDANANSGLDTIRFNIGSGLQTITPRTQLPDITSPVVIDGTTQPGFSGTPIIELNGSNVFDGLRIFAGNSTIRGLVMNRFQATAIYMSTLGENVIETNFIGINAAGDSAMPNQGNGVFIDSSSNNRIGDITSAARNVISANVKPNIAIAFSGSTGNIVRGNYIGTDRAGSIDLTDSTNGVILGDSASFNVIGGLQSGARNLISGNGGTPPTFPYDFPGIAIKDAGTSFNVIQANYIGVDWLGAYAMGNGGGILITKGASNNLIGSTSPQGTNIISGQYGDYAGIQIAESTTTNNVVQGNIIGPNRVLNPLVLSNYDGIWINNAPNNTIGGAIDGASNYIMANKRHGVLISGSAAKGNHIENNYIGADKYSQGAYPNLSCGVFIEDAPGNIVGGPHRLARNFIGNNYLHGIVIRGDTATANVVQSNFIGTNFSGYNNQGNRGNGILLLASGDTIGGHDLSLGNVIVYNGGIGVFDSAGANNTIRFNSIFSNESMGIDLAPRGITPNDSLDGDTGPNDLQNFPILDSAIASPGSIRVRGRLDSQPYLIYTVDFFKNDARDPSHFGEGQTWIGSTTLSCDAAGRADITVTFSTDVSPDQFITATAIDPFGNTSEFSRALCLLDSDGDGILDCWESEGDGIDVNADGMIDLNLYARGARANHKDIFVEVDYMFGSDVANRTLPLVQNAFASVKNKYVNNPDAHDGINLFAELNANDLPIPSAAWASDPYPEFFAAKKQFFGTDAERSDPNAANILEAKRLVYRYCIFADRYGTTGSSGQAELNEVLGGMTSW
ncbi:MAG: hypothetical protein HY707_04025 [Ignavibacteriae bacterium]|nr:hypothetical protein [Ignavibacteriota bacterium]